MARTWLAGCGTTLPPDVDGVRDDHGVVWRRPYASARTFVCDGVRRTSPVQLEVSDLRLRTDLVEVTV